MASMTLLGIIVFVWTVVGYLLWLHAIHTVKRENEQCGVRRHASSAIIGGLLTLVIVIVGWPILLLWSDRGVT